MLLKALVITLSTAVTTLKLKSSKETSIADTNLQIVTVGQL